MSRNKYPQETVDKILDVALKLFMEKGYDNTSIQLIIDNLGGLSKGAIYHHFKSKEDIFIAVYNRMGNKIRNTMQEVLNDKSLNGLEKLRIMFMSSMRNEEQKKFIASVPNLLKNPRFLALYMDMTINDIVPNYIYPIILEGIDDGSIKTDMPLEISHFLMLISNVWLNPLIYPYDNENMNNKLQIFNSITKSLGISLYDESYIKYTEEINKRKKELN